MTTIINGDSPSITFSDSTTQSTAVTAPSAVGQIPIGNSANGYTNATITAGAGITVTNASGSITIANSSPAVTSGEAKAWVKFNGNGSISGVTSYNVSSVVRNSTGNYTINFTNAFSDANYASPSSISYDLSSGSGVTVLKIISQTTTAVSVFSSSPAGSAVDSQYITVACFR